jgi:hypothetical protein
MRLRALIRGRSGPRRPVGTSATVATVATLPRQNKSAGGSVASVATVATVATVAGSPADWLDAMAQARPASIPALRWECAVDAMRELVASGAVADALLKGWHPLELVGACRHLPHDAPHLAGLVFSMHRGDQVKRVTETACILDLAPVAGANRASHIWRRVPGVSLLMPAWEVR